VRSKRRKAQLEPGPEYLQLVAIAARLEGTDVFTVADGTHCLPPSASASSPRLEGGAKTA